MTVTKTACAEVFMAGSTRAAYIGSLQGMVFREWREMEQGLLSGTVDGFIPP